MNNDNLHPNDIRNNITPERQAELERKFADNPLTQKRVALEAKIDAGLATQEEKDELLRISPLIPEKLTIIHSKMGRMSDQQTEGE